MLHKFIVFIIFSMLVMSSSGCDKIPELPFISKKKTFPVEGTIIAKVNDMAITLEQLEEEISNFNQLVGVPEAQITTREQKLAYLNDELIRRYLLYHEAVKLGLDKKPKAQQILKNLEVNVIANQFLQDEIENLVVTSSEVEEFYNIYKEQFRQQEERRIREIAVDSEVEARALLIELLQGADFAKLAREKSHAESASVGGNLGFIRKGQRGTDFMRFDEIAFSPTLETGQISNIFNDKAGYYIIKVEDIKGGQPKPLSEIWDEIKRNVLFLKQQQKLQELTNRLQGVADIIVYKEKIK